VQLELYSENNCLYLYFQVFSHCTVGARGVAQVLEYLPSKPEDLSSIPSTAKKQTNEKAPEAG
jgi:hypothetical protein